MALTLDPEVCYRALQTKDTRFDGQFFVAVYTTGIFCRPICPANTPQRQNCTFFPNAAAAQGEGFRPCLRCRPELAPHLLARVGTGTTVARALRLIAAGALDQVSVAQMATRLGVGDRHLRQLFTKHVGTSPLVVAQTRRLLFAKQLLDETALSMTDIAMSASFASIRRFNDVIQKTYGRSPSQLRRQPLQNSVQNLEQNLVPNPDAIAPITLKQQDPTGFMLLHYSSRFGPLGNLLFGWSQADSFMHRSVGVTGWFRRGIMPLVDLVRMDCPDKWTVYSYHRFWSLLWGAGLIVLSFVLPPILPV